MTRFTKSFAAPAVLAAASLVAVPASAAELPTTAHVSVVPTAHNHGPYVGTSIGWGTSWGSGWGGWGSRHRRHRGMDVGDILAGVVILGTIAAVANAAKNASRPTYRYPDSYPDRRTDDRRYDDRRYDDRRYDNRAEGPQGLQGAADMCLREVERNARAREVTRVERDAAGWQVFGVMADGAPFNCAIGADGRINRADVGGRAVTVGAADTDGQRSAQAAAESDVRPAYPGGPLPGDNPDTLPEAPTPANPV